MLSGRHHRKDVLVVAGGPVRRPRSLSCGALGGGDMSTQESAAAMAAGLPVDVKALVAREVEGQLAALRGEMEAKLAELRERTVDNRATLVVFSGDLDKVLAGFV